MNKIKLGTYVEDPITGFKGYAESRATYLYGCDRICVQPRMKEDGTIPDSRMMDEPQLLEVVGGEFSPIKPIPANPPKVLKGNVVKDPLNGVESTLTGRSVYLNGCSRVYLEPTKKYNKDVDPYWVDEQQIIDTGKTLLTKHNESPESSRATGGPARASSKYLEKIMSNFKELLDKLVEVAVSKEEYKDELLPVISTMLISIIEGHMNEGTKEAKDDYLFVCRGITPKGGNASITVDYDLIPMIQHLEACGEPEWEPNDVITLIKASVVDESLETDKLHLEVICTKQSTIRLDNIDRLYVPLRKT